MGLPALSRAHLVHILARLPATEWPAATASAGFERRGDRVVPEVRERPERVGEPARPRPRTPEPYRPGDLPDLPFWRIAGRRRLGEEEWPSGAPDWLQSAEPWDELPESDPRIPVPEPQPLVPRSRRARFLRRELASSRHGTAIDLERLCRQLAERRLPERLPRLLRPRWPGRVRLYLDRSPDLRPFHADFWRWDAHLRQILGPRLGRLVARDGQPPGRLRLGEAPLVILGDAGLYTPDSPRHRNWRAFGRRCLEEGVRPLLLAPCPVRYLDAEITRWFRCVPLERGARLRPLRIRGPAGHADGAGERAPDVPPATADLLAALAPGARTEPPLLRRLRLLLTGRGADIGCEREVWNHPGVFADELACALRPSQRDEAGRSFERLPCKLQAALVRARREGSRHLSPLVRLEEALIGGPWLEPQELGDALMEACRYAASLHRPRGAGLRQPLSAYIAGLGQRRRELLGQNRALALAWAIARREELRAGTLDGIPPGIDLADLRWLLEPGGEAVPVYLGQIGGELGLFPAQRGQPACRLAELQTAEDYWQARGLEMGDQGEVPPPRVRRLGGTLALDTARRYALTAGRERLELEAVRRPPWAAGVGRDGDGLFLELAERRLYWVPKGPVAIEGAELELPHGFWWDQGEHAAWLQAGRRLERPGWAVRHGVDPYGRWVEFEVQGVAQRMRWIPPGEFTMGSPEDEPERLGNEAQHPVILTRGLWLADTACTQALWRAVLGEGTSRSEGGELPVENVSWEDVVERFLPALNERVPGLDAALPTEAQWEYACRAGTTTPFWFGANISPEQVNYDGSSPYAGGAKGEYRGATVDVKALPANGWGLYQMHGNVWEWCADWLEGYPQEAAVDPAGPVEGRVRVLRGGSWVAGGGRCRSADRGGRDPGARDDFFGFRLSRGFPSRQAGSAGEGGEAAERGARGAAPDAPARGLAERLRSWFGGKREKP